MTAITKNHRKINFISFEGLDGSGKTTQIDLLVKYCEREKINFLIVREPGSSLIGEKIRMILKDNENNFMDDKAELFLFMAARAQLMREKIIPALKEKILIICDRFIDSSVAYQGIARNLGENFVKQMNDFATNNIKPDLTFFLDVTPEIIFKRKNKNLDRFETEGLDFYQKVYSGYKKIFCEEENKNRAVFIDGNLKCDEIHEMILNKLFA